MEKWKNGTCTALISCFSSPVAPRALQRPLNLTLTNQWVALPALLGQVRMKRLTQGHSNGLAWSGIRKDGAGQVETLEECFHCHSQWAAKQ